jgi:AmpD protein
MLEFLPQSGRLATARWLPSPNCDARPAGAQVRMLVLHCISLPPGRFGGGEIDALFCNRLDSTAHPYFAALEGLEVSAHFLVDRAGAITQYVDCDDRAWHAGESSYCGSGRCNDFSVGIELEGTETAAYTDAQYASLAGLVRALRRRYPALRQGPLVAHSDIAPGRKTDPGPSFDWRRLRRSLAGAPGEAAAGDRP